MTKRVLLTGATGFVGRQVLRTLEAQDVQLTLVARENNKSESRVKDNVITSPDLFAESPEWWARALQGIDTVIHVAWYAEPGQYLQSPKNLDCLQGTLNMAKGAVQANVRRFVGVGTCFEYDLSHGILSVRTPLKPLTSYAGAKAATYLALSQWLQNEGVEFAWCRLFYLHGEGEDTRRLVPYLRAKLAAGESAELTSGNQIRDYLDVSEAGLLIAGIALGQAQGPINVCSGRPITVRQFAEKIAEEYGRCDLLKFGARPDNLIDPICVVGLPN